VECFISLTLNIQSFYIDRMIKSNMTCLTIASLNEYLLDNEFMHEQYLPELVRRVAAKHVSQNWCVPFIVKKFPNVQDNGDGRSIYCALYIPLSRPIGHSLSL
jgi:hypothetical protein